MRFSRQRSVRGAGSPRVPAGLLPPPAPVRVLNRGRRSVPILDFAAVADGDVAHASESSTHPARLGLPALRKRSLPKRFVDENGMETSPGQATADPRAEAAAPDGQTSAPAAVGAPESNAANNGRPRMGSRAAPDSARPSVEAAPRDSSATTSAYTARAGSNASQASAAPANERQPREIAETALESRRPPERPPAGLEDWQAAAEAESKPEPPEPKPDRSVPEARSSRRPLSGPEALSSDRSRSSPDARPSSDRPRLGYPTSDRPRSGPDARPASDRPRLPAEEWRYAAEAESKAEPPRKAEPDRSISAAPSSAERPASDVDAPPGAKVESTKNEPRSRAQTAREPEAPEWAAGTSKPEGPARRLQRCVIVCHRTGPTARFAVVAVEGDSRDGPPTARSPSFAVSPARAVSRDRRARTAHDALVAQLAAVGWRQEDSGEEWYEAVFVRDIPERSGNSVNAAVVCRRLGNEARFEAIQLDDYGNATRLAASPPFSARRRGSARPTAEARALHAALVRYLRRLGWEADQSPDGDWYATPLTREQS
jgi:hypothetical protein